MRVAVVGGGDVERHPPSRALARQLDAAGVNVTLLGRVGVSQTPPAGLRARVAGMLGARADGGAPTVDADVMVPATRGDVGLALGLPGEPPLLAPPSWEVPRDRDVAWRAPTDPTLSTAAAGPALPLHQHPAVDGTPGTTPQRHDGRRVVVACRWSERTPARYLAAALEDAGVEVLRRDAIDWDLVGADVDAVVVVESPLPALPVTGTNPGVPLLLWAHHGEHHTATQLRLCARYRVDAVLLAHSWHLAHRFPRPVHRFPFGVPSELFSSPLRWEERPLDVAFAGSGIAGTGTYAVRGQLLTAIAANVPDERAAMVQGVTPDELARLYERARLVPNDCGSHHRPITMRVLEACGAGALLLSEDAPGLSHLLEPGAHHAVLEADPTAQVERLLAAGDSGDRARASQRHALAHHTTRHRVDDLMAAIDATEPASSWAAPAAVHHDALRAVADDLLLDDVLPLGLDHLEVEAQLPDRVVWREQRLERLAGRPLAHAVVVTDAWSGDGAAAVAAARRLLVVPAGRQELVELALARSPDARVRSAGVHVAVDLGANGYRRMEL